MNTDYTDTILGCSSVPLSDQPTVSETTNAKEQLEKWTNLIKDIESSMLLLHILLVEAMRENASEAVTRPWIFEMLKSLNDTIPRFVHVRMFGRIGRDYLENYDRFSKMPPDECRKLLLQRAKSRAALEAIDSAIAANSIRPSNPVSTSPPMDDGCKMEEVD